MMDGRIIQKRSGQELIVQDNDKLEAAHKKGQNTVKLNATYMVNFKYTVPDKSTER